MRPAAAPHSRARLLLPILKWGIFLVVLGFVGAYARRLWGEFDAHKLRLRWGWLALATFVSVAGWLPSVWYWRRLLAALGSRPCGAQILRSYYCGHPGKYVPGKAMVIIIRATLLAPSGVPAAATAYTVTLETLTYMAAGVVTAVLLFPWIASGVPQLSDVAEPVAHPVVRVLLPMAAVAGGIGGLAVLSRISVQLAGRLKGAVPGVGTLDQPIPLRTFAGGLMLFLAAWWLQGATLGLTLQALSAEAISWADWPLWTGTAAVSLVGGFLAVFAPGGLGVREGLLMELLRQAVGPHEAVAAAFALRAVSLAGELIAAGALYVLIPSPRTRRESDDECRSRRAGTNDETATKPE